MKYKRRPITEANAINGGPVVTAAGIGSIRADTGSSCVRIPAAACRILLNLQVEVSAAFVPAFLLLWLGLPVCLVNLSQTLTKRLNSAWFFLGAFI